MKVIYNLINIKHICRIKIMKQIKEKNGAKKK